MQNDKKKKMTKIEEEFNNVSDFYRKYVYPLFIKAWKQYLKDGEDRRRVGQLKEWESNVYTSVTQKLVDTMFSNFYDSEIFLNVIGLDEKGKKMEGVMKNLFNQIIEKTNVRGELEESAKDSFVCGYGVMKAIWKTEEVKVSRISNSKKKEFIISKYNLPSSRYVSNMRLFIDPIAKSIDDARYVYELRYLNIDEAISGYRKFFQMANKKLVEEKDVKAFIKNKIKKNKSKIKI